MQNVNKVIYPLMVEINQTIIEDIIYYVSLPQAIKEKWLKLEQKSNSNYNPIYSKLPTTTLATMLGTYLEGVIKMNPVSSTSNDQQWLVSFKPLNLKILINCFKIWVEEFYIKGFTKENKRKNGEDKDVTCLANELIELSKPEFFEMLSKEDVVLFDGGKAVDNLGYDLYPMRIVDSLMGQSLLYQGVETKLLYSNTKELITDTHDFHKSEDYFSFVIQLSVQTLPPDNKAYLNVDLSVRRWISRNSKKDGHIFLPTGKKCYIRVKGDRMQVIEAEYNKDLQENAWKPIDYRCLKESQVESNVPKFTEALECPEEYNRGRIGDVLIPYSEGINGIDTEIDSGLPFPDKITLFEFIKAHVGKIDCLSSDVRAINTRKIIFNTSKDFYIDKDPMIVNSGYFLEQLQKALDGGNLTVEVYAESEMRDSIVGRLRDFFGDNKNHEIKCFDMGDFCGKLTTTSESRKQNLPGFEARKNEICKQLKKVNTPTLAFVAIHGKEHFSKLEERNGRYKVSVDPKDAIRCGFAETGRLTQFLTIEEFEKEEKRVSRSDEVYEKKLATATNNNKRLGAQSKSDKLNKVINSSILDGFRQLGVVFDFASNKHMKGKKIVGVHMCYYKKTLYGSLPLFPIITTYDVDNSKVMVYCELIDKVDIPYWKGILGLSKLAAIKNTAELRKSVSGTTIYRRLDRLISKDESDHVIIIDSPTRKLVKGISNSEIDKAEKNTHGQVKKIFINDERFLELDKCQKGLSIVRLRHNVEVPSYFTTNADVESSYLPSYSGIFKYNDVYYSLDIRPYHERKAFDKQISKVDDPSSFSHRNLVEIYPLFVSGDEERLEENKSIAVGITDVLRGASIQFRTQKTTLPLPLHLAEKMEEYF